MASPAPAHVLIDASRCNPNLTGPPLVVKYDMSGTECSRPFLKCRAWQTRLAHNCQQRARAQFPMIGYRDRYRAVSIGSLHCDMAASATHFSKAVSSENTADFAS